MAAAFVRKHGEDNTGTAPSILLAAGVNAGNTLIYYIACDNTAGTDLPNVIDIACGTYTQGVDYDVYFVADHASASTSASAATRGFIIAIAVHTNMTGTVAVSASFSASPAKMVAVLAEFSGVDPTTISVAANGGTGNTNRFQSSVPADDLVLGLVSCETNAAMTIQADWTEPGGDGAVFTTGGGGAANVSMICGYIIPPSPNTYFLNAATGFSGDGGSVAVTLAAAATGDLADADDTSHAVTSDTVALTQVHNVATANGAHALISDVVSLSQNSNLVTANGAHAVTSDQVTVTIVTNLVVADATHGHAADNVVLTQVHVLAVNAGAHAHAADNVAVTQVHNIGVNNAAHAVTSDEVALTIGGSGLVVADAAHAVTSDTPALTQVHTLVIADGSHALTSDTVAITTGGALAINDGAHAVTSGNVSLTQVHVLLVDSAAHALTSDGVALEQTGPTLLEIDNATHFHITDEVTLRQRTLVYIATTPVREPYAWGEGGLTKFYLQVEGITYWKAGAEWFSGNYQEDTITGADEVYRGGYEYEVSQAKATELEALGFTVRTEEQDV